jgi:hypothetical protein
LTVVGATGHQQLPADAIPYLVDEVRNALSACEPPLWVASSLAGGADQLIAREALRNGGRLLAIVPARGYESTFSPKELRSYKDLMAQADEVTRLDFPEPSERAYWAAGQAIVDRCDVLVAIWDGQPARGLGGTGDVVDYAAQVGKEVRVIWPNGLARV